MSERTDRPLYVFLHMHKCAGSYVVKNAQAAGFVLPEGHHNGNLHGKDGRPIKYAAMSPGDLRGVLLEQVSKGTNFIAMEWDFPRLETFPQDLDIVFLTVLRDPLSRAISNYRMDKINGWCDREIRFLEYIDHSALYRSNNYFVRMLCNAGISREVGVPDLDYACSVLEKFRMVAVLEQNDLPERLERIGIDCKDRSPANTLSSKEKRFLLPPELLEVSVSDMTEFCKNNYLDMTLYMMFMDRRRFRLPL